MRQLLYVSSAASQLGDIAPIVTASIRHNRRAGVTGLLWTDGRRFLQVLEGEEASVAATFARIREDRRHRGIVVLHDRVVMTREFGEWAMASRDPGDDADTFDARMRACLAHASPTVRGTFEGLIAVRRAA